MAAIAIAAAPNSAFDASMALSVSRVVKVAANPSSGFAATVTLSGRNRAIQARPSAAFTAAVTLSGRNHAIQARPVSSFTASCSLAGGSANVAIYPVSSFAAVVNLTGASDTHGMSVCGIVQDIITLFGVDCMKSAPAFMLNRAINDLNDALQTVWNRAADRSYWTSSTLTITLGAGNDSYQLPNNVQNVTGPCRLASNHRPLAAVGTMAELVQFSSLYMDGEAAVEPLAYHIDREAQAGNDPANCHFIINQAVAAETSFLLDVVTEAPRYTTSDLTTCPIIPMPHRYVESLLMPVVRYKASTFYLFAAKDQKETIDREYLQAAISLGLADPLPGNAGDNLETRKEAAPR